MSGPDPARICREYLADLEAAGIREPSRLAYGWRTLPNGLPIDRRIRRVYSGGAGGPRARRRSRAAEPVPADTVERFVKWLNEPSPPGPRGISRYLYALYLERPDLQLAFQDIGGEDANRFRAWLHGDGIAQEKIPASLLPPLSGTARNGALRGP